MGSMFEQNIKNNQVGRWGPINKQIRDIFVTLGAVAAHAQQVAHLKALDLPQLPLHKAP